jgi:regulator of replication initiation timing
MEVKQELEMLKKISEPSPEEEKRIHYLEALFEAQLEKEKAIKTEANKIKRIFSDISDVKKKSIQGLIEEAAFMKVTLKGLKDQLNLEGPIDEMPQGEYSILRQHPAAQLYNSMIQRYTTVQKELIAVLPKEQVPENDDGFEAFVNGK